MLRPSASACTKIKPVNEPKGVNQDLFLKSHIWSSQSDYSNYLITPTHQVFMLTPAGALLNFTALLVHGFRWTTVVNCCVIVGAGPSIIDVKERTNKCIRLLIFAPTSLCLPLSSGCRLFSASFEKRQFVLVGVVSLLQKSCSPPTIAGAIWSGAASQRSDDCLCYQCSNRQINPALTTRQLAALLARL